MHKHISSSYTLVAGGNRDLSQSVVMRLEALGVPEEVSSGFLDAGSPRGTLSWTPLQYACALGDEELVRELLLEKKCDPNESGKTRFAYSLLHIAVRFGHKNVMDLLLEEGSAEFMPVDSAVSASPLHLAVVKGSLQMVEKLLPFMSQTPLTTNGTTPNELAKRLGHVEMAQMLKNHGERLRTKQQLGDWLASIGMMEYAPLLHRAGYDDANFLLVTGLSESTLDSFKIEKEGHRMKLKSLYMLREFLQGQEKGQEEGDDEDDEDDDEEAGSTGEEDSDEDDSDEDDE